VSSLYYLSLQEINDAIVVAVSPDSNKTFYRMWRFITFFTETCHWNLPSATSNQNIWSLFST